MKKLINLRMDLRTDFEFENSIADLLQNEAVRSMKRFIQHRNVSCLEHSINVSYNSYILCKLLGLDCQSAARGALLHDLFLYDWHVKDSHKRPHAIFHPYVALKNANEIARLNKIERDIIKKHMWPLTLIPPRYMESLVVSLADKYCALFEIMGFYRRTLYKADRNPT